MSTQNYTPFFHLRWDFAIEMGFLDCVRRPLTDVQFAAYCQREKKIFSNAALRDHNWKRAVYPNPQHVFFGGYIQQGKTEPTPFLSDGKMWAFPPFAGLFQEANARARISMGEAPGELPYAFPPPTPNPVGRAVMPTLAVFLYTESSQALVAPYVDCRDSARKLNASKWAE